MKLRPTEKARWWMAGILFASSIASSTAIEFKPASGNTQDQDSQVWFQALPQPSRMLSKEPTYAGTPLYIEMAIGDAFDSILCGALETHPATSNLTLHFDANNNGDLTDDPSVQLHKDKKQGYVWQTDPLEITARYFTGTERKFHVAIEISPTYRGKKTHAFSWTLVDHMEGRIDIGNAKNILVGLYDTAAARSMPNGCFGDVGIDHLRIDANNDGKLDEQTEDTLLGKIFGFQEALWEIQSDSEASDVRISPCRQTACRVQINMNLTQGSMTGGSVYFAGQDGFFLPCTLGKEAKFLFPAGRYMATAQNVTATNSAGQKWTLDFSTPYRISIEPTTATTLAFGAPLTVEARCASVAKRGQTLSVSTKVTGAAGEEYGAFYCDRKSIPPHVKILKGESTVVTQGNMQYG